MAGFDLDDFIADCKRAVREDSSHKAVREVVARAVADPAAVLAGLGPPRRSEVQKLYNAPDLTILNVLWAPGMRVQPHNHEMWAVIGIYAGREDNDFFRRVGRKAEKAGAKTLETGDAEALGRHVVHAVTNPLDKITAAIHVYGGDFFEIPRLEWDPETLEERPFDVEASLRLFEEANERLDAERARRDAR